MVAPHGSPSPMACPECGEQDVLPLPESTLVIGWYACPNCEQQWSVRVRGGESCILLTDVEGRDEE